MNEQYLAIGREAKREKATIYWGDEMGLRSDHVSGTSYAPLGKPLWYVPPGSDSAAI